MPNGGLHHCGHCRHHDQARQHCRLRDVAILVSHWTTCRNFNGEGGEIRGPVFAIVCEVKQGRGSYASIPYFDGVRVVTATRDGGSETFVEFTDVEGTRHEFDSVSQYIEFYESSGRLI